MWLYFNKYPVSLLPTPESLIMQPKRSMKSFMRESALWTVANALGVLVPTLACYVVLHSLLGMPMLRVSMVMSATALLTLTWGSWSGLVWAQNRLLRASMQMMTVLPGLLLIGFAATGVYVGQGAIIFWLALGATGAGTIAASYMLAQNIGATTVSTSPKRFISGLAVFPIFATVGSGSVYFLWYSFLSNPFQSDWRAIFSLSFFFVTTLSIVLVSTIVPALSTLLCRRIAALRD